MKKFTPLIKPTPPYGRVRKEGEQPVVIDVLPLLGKWLIITFCAIAVVVISATAYMEYFQ